MHYDHHIDILSSNLLVVNIVLFSVFLFDALYCPKNRQTCIFQYRSMIHRTICREKYLKLSTNWYPMVSGVIITTNNASKQPLIHHNQRPPSSAVSKYIVLSGDTVDWISSFHILHMTHDRRLLRYAEDFMIGTFHPTLCKQRGFSVTLALCW